MVDKLNIFIGFDSREPVAYHVLSHSILRRSSMPVTITPVCLRTLSRVYTRPRNPLESTEFSLTRFLVPYLSEYKGISIFMDCDMLCLVDMADILSVIITLKGAVGVCQHDYIPRDQTKFLGQKQTKYPRKNWSSFMIFKNQMCTALSPDYVNHAEPLDLHRFNWCEDAFIGTVPLEWNWLCGEYRPNPAAKILHFTNGGPWFAEYKDTDHADLWFQEYRSMISPGV